MRVARKHDVHPRIHLLDDVEQWAGNAAATLVIVTRRGAEALVDRNENGVGTRRLQLRHKSVDRGRFVSECQAIDPAWRDEDRRVLQRQTDNPDRHFALRRIETLDARGGQQRFASFGQHIGREEREIGSSIRVLHRARHADAGLFAAAPLDAQQFAPATVEFVIADRVEIEADAVHHADGGFVQEQGRRQWAGADEIACRHHHRKRRLRPRRRYSRGEVGGARSLYFADVAFTHRDRDRAGQRQQIAVKIVEAYDAHGDCVVAGRSWKRCAACKAGECRSGSCRPEPSGARCEPA